MHDTIKCSIFENMADVHTLEPRSYHMKQFKGKDTKT